LELKYFPYSMKNFMVPPTSTFPLEICYRSKPYSQPHDDWTDNGSSAQGCIKRQPSEIKCNVGGEIFIAGRVCLGVRAL